MGEETPTPRRSTRTRKPRTVVNESPSPPRKRARRSTAQSGRKKELSDEDPDFEATEDGEEQEAEAAATKKAGKGRARARNSASKTKNNDSTTAPAEENVDTAIERNADEEAASRERSWGALTAKDTLKVVTWNVASLRSILKYNRFLPYVEKELPDLLCLQETKMTEEALKDVPEVEGYTAHWNHSEKKGYSGVAIYVSDKLEERTGLKVEEVKKGMGLEEADKEGRVLTCYFDKFVVINAYVPNSGGKLTRLGFRTEQYEPAMRSFLSKLREEYRVVYCGDLNVAHEVIDIHNSKGNQKSAGHTPQERAEFTKLLEEGWSDIFRERYPQAHGYTYYSRRFGDKLRKEGKGWRLDYHVVDAKSSERVQDMYVRENVEGSDHLPVVLEYKF